MALQRGETTATFEQAPADVCDNCGEYYVSSDMTTQVMDKPEAVVRSGAEVEIVKFAA